MFVFTHNTCNLLDREEPAFNTITMSACADPIHSRTVWMHHVLLSRQRLKDKAKNQNSHSQQ